MFARRFILPFWPLMGILAGAAALTGVQLAIAWAIGSDTVVYAGACAPLDLIPVKRGDYEVVGLRVAYDGNEATTTDPEAIRAFHDGAAALYVEVNAHGKVVKIAEISK